MISTSKWCAKHLFIGQNKQSSSSGFPVWGGGGEKDAVAFMSPVSQVFHTIVTVKLISKLYIE